MVALPELVKQVADSALRARFAQELHTPEPVSPRRLDALWAAVK